MSLPNPGSQVFSLMFSSQSVTGFKLRYTAHFKLIFIYGMRYGVRSTLISVAWRWLVIPT